MTSTHGVLTMRRQLPWLVWRNVVLMVRHQGFLIATTLHLAALACFVLIWGDGVPIWREDTLLVQFLRLDLGLLAVILPWVAIRCTPDDSRDRLVQFAALTASRPSWLVLARAVGSCCALLTLVLSALPMLVIAQQISALPASMVLRALLPVAALSVLVAAIAATVNLFLGSRLMSWLVATVATVLTVKAMPATVMGVTTMIVLAAVITLALATSADRRLRYLSDAEPL